MSKAVLPATTSRRGLLAGATIGTALTAIGFPVTAAAGNAPHPDPVVVLYGKWLALEAACDDAERRCSTLRAAFVDRYGEVLKVEGAYTRWNSDPRRPELDRLVSESTDLCDESLELLDAMIATPATSLQGVHCKLLATISVMKCIELPKAEPEYHEIMALAVLRDAVRAIGNGVAA